MPARRRCLSNFPKGFLYETKVIYSFFCNNIYTFLGKAQVKNIAFISGAAKSVTRVSFDKKAIVATVCENPISAQKHC